MYIPPKEVGHLNIIHLLLLQHHCEWLPPVVDYQLKGLLTPALDRQLNFTLFLLESASDAIYYFFKWEIPQILRNLALIQRSYSFNSAAANLERKLKS